MFIIYTIDDKILLKPEELNKKFNGLEISYEDILLIKLKEKYLGKVLLNNGIVVSIKKFFMKSNLIVEIEGLINVEVRKKRNS
jgi:DNA-directed RNA polymerase subunit E'/Rpb7